MQPLNGRFREPNSLGWRPGLGRFRAHVLAG